MKKRLVVALTTILCTICVILQFSGSPIVCQAESEIVITGSVENQEVYAAELEEQYNYWLNADFNTLLEENRSTMDQANIEIAEGWIALKEKLGATKNITEKIFALTEEGSIEASLIAVHENGRIKFTIFFSLDGQYLDTEVVEYAEEENLSLSDKMTKAGINTIMSITIVFVVLIFISVIISLMKFIPKILGLEKKESVEIAKEVREESSVEEDVTDDTELVAVITAAIMASMGDEAPADGLVISSIKRRTASKWKTR